MTEKTELEPRTQAACDIAAGRAQPDDDADAIEIIGAKKDKNAKGNGPEWYRMVLRDGSWRYVSDDRLPAGNYLASERRASVKGDVFPGELVAVHDRGAPVESVWLVESLTEGESGSDCLRQCDFTKKRGGKLKVTLPDGTEITVADPRHKEKR